MVFITMLLVLCNMGGVFLVHICFGGFKSQCSKISGLFLTEHLFNLELTTLSSVGNLMIFSDLVKAPVVGV